jgi:branched-chain amino acid transport system substrate-binding protein
MNKIKLGLPISLTGNYSIQGKESFEGVKLWVREINAQGGILIEDQGKNLPIEFIYYDDESLVDRCRQITKKLILEDEVDLLLGPYSSSLALASAEVAEEHNKTLWNHGGSTDEMEERNFKNVISSITPTSQYAAGIIEVVRKEDPNARRIAAFSAGNSGFSTRVANGAKLYGEERGFDVKEFKFISGTKDFSGFLDILRDYGADLILGMGRAEDDLALAGQIMAEGIYSKAAGFIVASIKLFKDEFGDASEGFLSSPQWEKGIQISPDIGPTPEEFFSKFVSVYGKEPDFVAAQGYNVGIIIEKCIQETGTLDDLALREVAKGAQFKTFYGDFKTDSNGNQIGHKMVVVQWQKGEKVIVYPDSIAQAKIVYPMTRPR